MGKDLRGKKLGKGIVQRKDGTYCARAMVNGEGSGGSQGKSKKRYLQ